MAWPPPPWQCTYYVHSPKWTGCRGDDIISLLWTIVRRNKFPRVKGPHILLCIEVFGSKSFHNKKLIHERKDFQLLHCWRLFALHIVNYLRKKLLVSLSTLHSIWAKHLLAWHRAIKRFCLLSSHGECIVKVWRKTEKRPLRKLGDTTQNQLCRWETFWWQILII